MTTRPAAFTPRQLALGGALAATLAATAWVATRPDGEAAVVAATAAPRRAAPADRPGPASTPPTAAPLPAAARQPWAEASPEQLAAWQPPAVPPPPPAAAPEPPPPPAPPMAPPLAYQMIGRLVEGEGARAVDVALLAGPTSTLSVKRGDVIDGQWRVEQVTPGGVTLTWLPAKLPQTLVFRAIP